jgi:hypothetical protein
VDATAINAHGYGFWGTVLAPYAHVNFSNGSFDGGLYAVSLTGNAEGHINALYDRDENCEACGTNLVGNGSFESPRISSFYVAFFAGGTIGDWTGGVAGALLDGVKLSPVSGCP